MEEQGNGKTVLERIKEKLTLEDANFIELVEIQVLWQALALSP